jgi:hypothetical protein
MRLFQRLGLEPDGNEAALPQIITIWGAGLLKTLGGNKSKHPSCSLAFNLCSGIKCEDLCLRDWQIG